MAKQADLRSAIAVVGLAGRFPLARDVRELWSNLERGVPGIRALEDGELARAGVPEELLRDPDYVKVSADLADVELFEPELFGLGLREAQATDPQQRVLLELAWEALDDAAHPPSRFEGAIGAFVGASRNDYVERVLASRELVDALGAYAIEIGCSRDFLATRIAYALDLRGPCLTVQTACSTSLVAVHLACQSLLGGECDLALAGGASIRLPQGVGYRHQRGGVASADGACRAFDARASGTVAGNGAALVALRRLEDALADGDPIRALILATAVNNDGAAKVGFTAPSVDGQSAAIEEALALAGVEPRTIGYVEAHGTATPLGDPIEVAALTRAFGDRVERGRCALGSIKSSLGHLDAAAGVAGLVKAVLALERCAIPPSPYFERANPALRLEQSPFRVNRELERWPRASEPRRAGVSSFGIGGTNAHAVLQEAPAVESAPDRTPQLVVLSARTESALERMGERLATVAGDASELADVAWTLQVGRRELAHRAAFVARDRCDLERSRSSSSVRRSRVERAASPIFLFPGQGAQHAGMAAGLRASNEIVRRELERCAEIVRARTGVDLLALVHPTAELEADARAELDRTRWTQPALFAVELALARAWIALGVRPAAMVGHSIGELVAACVAEVLELEDALRLVLARAEAMAEAPPGAMLAVASSEQELARRLAPPLSIASINGPRACVAAGPIEAIAALERALEDEQVACKRLRTSHAFHTASMEAAAARVAEVARSLRLRAPRIPFASNVTGAWITDAQATDPAYWGEQVRRPVRLADGLRAALARAAAVALEVGPGRTFAPLVRAIAPQVELVTSLPAQDARVDDALHWLDAIGRAWTRGVAIDWRALHGRGRRRVSLPSYPFERRRAWVDGAQPARPTERTAPTRAVDFDGSADERAIVRAWRDALAVEIDSRDADFLALGGSSLLAIQVAERLRRELAVELAVADLLAHPRLSDLAARIGALRAGASSRVEFQTSVGSPILACVPGIDGEPAIFAALARELQADARTIGLRAPADFGAEGFADVAALARRFAIDLAAVAGERPMWLAGHSFGGLIALEVAAALLERGALVAGIDLFDTRLPAPDDDVDALLASPPPLTLALIHARARHRPRPAAARTILWLAADEKDALAAQRTWLELGWPTLELRRAAGDHVSMLAPPNVVELALDLRARLDGYTHAISRGASIP